MPKAYLNETVYEAAIKRIDGVLSTFPAFYVSFSGGKDSGALLQMVIDRARLLGRLPVPVMFFDWETCYRLTIEFVERQMARDEVEPYWLCMPECEDNGSSIFERYWKPWDPAKKDLWVRPMPDHPFVIHTGNMPEEWRQWYNPDSYSVWVVKHFGDWLADRKGADDIACFIGMRSDESYGRHMLVAAEKNRTKANPYTYKAIGNGDKTWLTMPLYDWAAADVWKCAYDHGYDYNRAYDKFYLAGKSPQEMRICNAYGESQKQDLDQWRLVEPETWRRLVERVEGANFGCYYNRTNLNRLKTKKPKDMTWEAYTRLLFNSLPPAARENYEYRFRVIFRWFKIYSGEKLGLERWWFDTKKEAKAFVKANKIPICYVGAWETMANFI
ncbi:MAG: DUF3440 domain-containing protein, partial [Clostridia bacterium]